MYQTKRQCICIQLLNIIVLLVVNYERLAPPPLQLGDLLYNVKYMKTISSTLPIAYRVHTVLGSFFCFR